MMPGALSIWRRRVLARMAGTFPGRWAHLKLGGERDCCTFVPARQPPTAQECSAAIRSGLDAQLAHLAPSSPPSSPAIQSDQQSAELYSRNTPEKTGGRETGLASTTRPSPQGTTCWRSAESRQIERSSTRQ